MITCPDARNALLDADLAELRGTTRSPLSEHLAWCDACRRLAARILAATDGLAAARTLHPRRALVEALALSAAEARRVRRSRRLWLAAAPTLAAAGITFAVLARGPATPTPMPPSVAESAPPLVEAPAAQVAVFATDNPSIVVVWQF